MKYPELQRRLKSSSRAPVYILCGPEIYLINKAIKGIVNVIPEDQRDFNVDVYTVGQIEMPEVLASANTLPFLAPRRVVLLRDVDKIRAKTRDAELLRAYLKDPAPDSIFIVQTADVNAGIALSKSLGDGGIVVEFRALKGRPLAESLRSAAREKGVEITSHAVDFMIETVGSDLGRIHQEMEKLAVALGKGSVVDVEEIRFYVCGYSYQTMFDLVAAVGRRDINGALALVEAVFTSGAEVHGLIGMLARRFRILWHFARDAGEKDRPLPSVFRVAKWQLPEYKEQGKFFLRRETEFILETLLTMDRTVKSTSVPPRLLVERFILSLSSELATR